MTAEGAGLTDADIERIREKHERLSVGPFGTPVPDYCWCCNENWPCETVRLLAELERARKQIETYRQNATCSTGIVARQTLEITRLKAREAALVEAARAEGYAAALEQLKLVGASYYHDDHDEQWANAIWMAAALLGQAGSEPYDSWIADQRKRHEARILAASRASAEGVGDADD